MWKSSQKTLFILQQGFFKKLKEEGTFPVHDTKRQRLPDLPPLRTKRAKAILGR